MKKYSVQDIENLSKDSNGGCTIDDWYFSATDLEKIKEAIRQNTFIAFERIGTAVINPRWIFRK